MQYDFLFNAKKLDEELKEELNALQKTTTSSQPRIGIRDYFRWFWDNPEATAGRECLDHRYT